MRKDRNSAWETWQARKARRSSPCLAVHSCPCIHNRLCYVSSFALASHCVPWTPSNLDKGCSARADSSSADKLGFSAIAICQVSTEMSRGSLTRLQTCIVLAPGRAAIPVIFLCFDLSARLAPGIDGRQLARHVLKCRRFVGGRVGGYGGFGIVTPSKGRRPVGDDALWHCRVRDIVDLRCAGAAGAGHGLSGAVGGV